MVLLNVVTNSFLLGDNLLVSSYDRKVAWMDLDLSTRPYKLLKYHHEASRRAMYLAFL